MKEEAITNKAHEELRSQLKVDTNVIENSFVVTGSGELDYHSRNRLMTVVDGLFAQKKYDFVLDLSNITFIDSSGLSYLVIMHRISENNKGIIPCIFSDNVKRVLSITNLDKLFLMVNSQLEGLDKLKGDK